MDQLTVMLSLFESHLQQRKFEQAPATLYEPVNYLLGLGGKRLRPVLAMMGYYQFADDVEAALPAAMAVEMFHNFSLMHDDIMDQAPMRRGMPTVHSRYGLNAAILSGDVMLIYAYAFLMETQRAEALPAMVRVFNQVAIDVCEGQQMDMDFESVEEISIDAYLAMIERKTAVLLAASLQLGALAAGASAADQALLAEYGRLNGIAFQLQDDYLDVFGQSGRVGKRPAGDIVQNKKTFLYLKALERADAPTRAELLAWYRETGDARAEEKVAAVRAIMERLEVPAALEALRDDYHARAEASLDRVSAPADRKQGLRAYARLLLQRSH